MLWLGGLVSPSYYSGQYRVALVVTSGCRFDEGECIRFRFVIGHLQDPEAQKALAAEVWLSEYADQGAMLKARLQVDSHSQCHFMRLPVCKVTASLSHVIMLVLLGVSFPSCKL